MLLIFDSYYVLLAFERMDRALFLLTDNFIVRFWLFHSVGERYIYELPAGKVIKYEHQIKKEYDQGYISLA